MNQNSSPQKKERGPEGPTQEPEKTTAEKKEAGADSQTPEGGGAHHEITADAATASNGNSEPAAAAGGVLGAAASEDPLTPENEFAEMMGLTVDAVASVRTRALQEGAHWIRTHVEGAAGRHGRVLYTAAGVELLLKEMQSCIEELKAMESPREAILIVRRGVPNPKVLVCIEEGTSGPMLTLRVHNARMYRPGQRVQAQHSAGAIWNQIGARPRWPGDIKAIPPLKKNVGGNEGGSR